MPESTESGGALTGAPPLRQPYRDIWAAAGLAVVGELTHDDGWQLDPDATMATPPPPVELAAHWELSGTLNGKLQIRLQRRSARALAALIRAAGAVADDEAAISEAETEAVTEVLQRIAAAAAAGLAEGGWGAVTIELRHLGPLRRTVELGDTEFPLRFCHPQHEALELDLSFDAGLREQFKRGPATPAARRRSDAPVMAGSAPLDLLLDVELDVTLRFGGRQMPLNDVLDLAPGSVLELDRQIDDPVELLVGGRVAAWGEVVVVDGNYGLRITRLARRSDRLAAIGAEL